MNSAWRLLGRPECHLCETFQAELSQAFPTLPLERACVDDDPEWRFAYGREIPVLLDPHGQAVCRSFFSAAEVQARLDEIGAGAD